ncbi:hypothetical protein CEXT_447331 [Caerostris extrusa]|uniref:Uncharacterized protein n=1 Tax=Caerostris extrusa TaxID=172846 RepID=A0AAV4TEA2_CAEEX|nr:hypothetical protein CEXT_447331 [Caerostris extrusa]
MNNLLEVPRFSQGVALRFPVPPNAQPGSMISATPRYSNHVRGIDNPLSLEASGGRACVRSKTLIPHCSKTNSVVKWSRQACFKMQGSHSEGLWLFSEGSPVAFNTIRYCLFLVLNSSWACFYCEKLIFNNGRK